jgi:murein endopeptidase
MKIHRERSLFFQGAIASYHEPMRFRLTQISHYPGTARLAHVGAFTALLLLLSCASSKEQREADLINAADDLCRDIGGTYDLLKQDAGKVESDGGRGDVRVCLRRGPPTPRREQAPELAPPLVRRTATDISWGVPMPVVDAIWPHLGLSQHGSVSVGAVSSGQLFNSAELPLVGPHHVVLHEQSLRRTNFGSDELIALVESAAAAVAVEFPGAIMTVGNVSRQGGGRIPWSISHRVGRDVDISFYLMGDDGEQVVLPDMVSLAAPDGTADSLGIHVRFDVAKNWALLHHVLTWDGVQVQYVFVADHLIDAMFALALKEGVKSSQLDNWRAKVRQPRGTLPHDDHFHIRILCSHEDLAEGCRDIFGGRERVPMKHGGYRQRTKELLAIAKSDEAEERRVAALTRLGWMRAPGAKSLAFQLLDGQSTAVIERAALSLLELVDASPRVATLVAFLSRSKDGAAIRSSLRLLRKTSSRYARKLEPLLGQDRVVVTSDHFWTGQEDLLAGGVRLLGWAGNLASGSKLIPFLEHDREAVRSAALFALRSISGAEVFPDTILAVPPKDLRRQWRRFARRHRDVDDNFRKTLSARGYAVKRNLGPKERNQLLSAILDVDWVSLNAQRILRKLTGNHVPLGLKDKSHVRWLWKKIVRRKWR